MTSHFTVGMGGDPEEAPQMSRAHLMELHGLLTELQVWKARLNESWTCDEVLDVNVVLEMVEAEVESLDEEDDYHG